MDSRKDVVKVERGAFVDSGGTVYVVEGPMARRRTARLGAMSVGEVEILSGGRQATARHLEPERFQRRARSAARKLQGADVIEMQRFQGVPHGRRRDPRAEGFHLKIEPHEFVAITGPSGSGKTTFLNVAGLLEEFTSGKYLLDGKDVSRLKDDERSRIRNEKIGFIFQSFNLIPDLNIYDNVEVPLHYRGFTATERRKRVRRALERVGLAQRMKHIPSQLSGGQQQRAAIARALAGEPRVILADEPTGNLDTTMSGQIMDLLEEINASGTTILMVTHNPDLAMRAHRHIEIVDGSLAASRAGNRAAPVATAIIAATGTPNGERP